MTVRLCPNTIPGRHYCNELLTLDGQCRRCAWHQAGRCYQCGEPRQKLTKLFCDHCAADSLRRSNDRSRAGRIVARRAYDRARYLARKGRDV